jgi:nicotinate-nucleotide--dimethylbenzimidazole phosphoribosyltransferase
MVEWLAAWQATTRPMVERPLVAVFAASHGVAMRGVSAYPPEVTHQMLGNFAAGGAAINQICAQGDVGLKIFDLAVDRPTPDIATDEAMDEAACAATMAYGMEAVAGGTDLLCVGEMGIGNTTVAACIYHALYGGKAEDWVGPGTGLDAAGLAHKADVVRLAVARHAAAIGAPLEILRRLGGREIAAIAGAILAARHQRVPVILDGYVTTAAAAVLHALDPRALDHCLAGHLSAEPAHRAVLKRLGLEPVLDLGLRLGEGTGAALAAGVVRAALACWRDMATFESAGVARKDAPTAH